MSGWTKEEIDILKENYPLGGCRLCIEKGLNRDKLDIQRKAHSRKIRRLTEAEGGLPRTERSKGIRDIIKKYYPIGGATLCSEKGVKYNIGEIKHIARELGLEEEEGSEWTEKEYALLREYYPLGGESYCILKGLGRTKRQIKVKVIKEGLKKLTTKEVIAKGYRFSNGLPYKLGEEKNNTTDKVNNGSNSGVNNGIATDGRFICLPESHYFVIDLGDNLVLRVEAIAFKVVDGGLADRTLTYRGKCTNTLSGVIKENIEVDFDISEVSSRHFISMGMGVS